MLGSSLRRALAVAVVLAVSMLGLTSCSKDDSAKDTVTPEETMAAAKKTLDDTTGVQIDLTTDDLPDGVRASWRQAGSAPTPPHSTARSRWRWPERPSTCR